MESRGNTVRNGLLTSLFLSARLITPCSKPCGFDTAEAVQQEQVEPSLRGLPQHEQKPTPPRVRKVALITPIDSAASG